MKLNAQVSQTTARDCEVRKITPYVCLLRMEERPSLFAEALALFLKAINRTLIYANPQDVRLDGSSVKGRVFNGEQWEWCQTDMPLIIDAAPFVCNCAGPYAALAEYFENNTCLVGHGGLSNSALQNLLSSNEEFREYSIWALELADTGVLFDAIAEHEKIIVKPDAECSDGRVFLIDGTAGNDVFVVRSKEGVSSFDFDAFSQYAEEHFSGCGYIVEEYVDTSSIGGDPFTFRILMARGMSKGKWRRIARHIQVGFGEQVISNRSGGRAHVSPYFEINRPGVSDSALEKINFLEQNLPYLIENELGFELPLLGCTVGVSPDGAVRILSADLFPETYYFETQAAWARRFYYAQKLQAYGSEIGFKPQMPWLSVQDDAKVN